MMIQHFVSQHLGRGTGTVEADEGGHGAVHLTFAGAEPRHAAFSFSLAVLAARYPGQPDLEQFALRLAIGQLHRDWRKTGMAAGLLPLSDTAPPWLGDFGATPFGGGTVGFLRRNGVMDERRHGNNSMEDCVNLGLYKRKSEGRRAARCFLEQASVPEAIIRRVLSHTAQRRKTRLSAPESAAGADALAAGD